MKKLKILLMLCILLCFGFALSSEVHAQGGGPKLFEVNDILPATTQLRIIIDIPNTNDERDERAETTNSYFEIWGYNYSSADFDFNFSINDLDLDKEDYNLSKLVNNEWVSTEYLYYGIISIIIDTSTWTETQRTIVYCSPNFPIYWEDLNAPQGYTITFETNGGTTIPDIEDATELPNPLPIPTKSGYTFEGWYYDSDFTNEAFANDPLTDDVILYARWLPGKLFEKDDVLPAGYIKISWDFTDKPIPDEAVTFSVRSGDDVFNDLIIEIDFNFGGYDHLKIFNGGSVEHFNVDTPGFTIITLTESVTITDLEGTDGITSLDYNVYIGDGLTWEVISQDYLNGFIEAREIYAFRYMGGPWMSGEAAWNHGYDKGSEEAWDEGFEYGTELYGYYDPITEQWLSVEEYLELYGTDKPGQSDFYNNFDKYFIPAMIIVFGGAIVLTILKVFKGRE